MERDRTVLPERNLDLLRAGAVLAVFVSHVVKTVIGHDALFSSLGLLGVLVFFVHTALVLMSSLERLRSQEASWVAVFYVRRAARIYPLAWATIALCVVGQLPYSTIPGDQVPLNVIHAPLTVAANVGMVQNLLGFENVQGVLWSLPLEMQMYVTLPLCFIVAIRPSRWFAATLVGVIGVASLVLWVPAPGFWRLGMLTYGPCFFGGILAFHLLYHKRNRVELPSWCWPVLLAGAGLAFLSIGDLRGARGWVFCLALGSVIPFVREMPPSLVSRITHQIARYSYGIYLLHMPAHTMAFEWGAALPISMRWVTYVVLVVALPPLAYHLIESPAMRLGYWMTERHRVRGWLRPALPVI